MSDDSMAKYRRPRKGIELPEENFPADDYEEPVGPGPARAPDMPEVISRAEEKYNESQKKAPPDSIVSGTPMTKRSIVTPVEVNAHTFWGFMEALSPVVYNDDDYPITKGIKIRFVQDDDRSRLLLEAAGPDTWAAASLDARGGNEEFAAVIPLQRAISVVKMLSERHGSVHIGLSEEKIHIGNFSFPFLGRVDHFPAKPKLDARRMRVVFTTSDISEIIDRVIPALGSGDSLRHNISKTHISFEHKAAVATNGHRMHILQMPTMGVEIERDWPQKPDGLKLPVEVLKYIRAVEGREYTGLIIGEYQIMVGHEDFGLLTPRDRQPFVDWKRVCVEWPGQWMAPADEFLSTVKEASLILSSPGDGIDFFFDRSASMITIRTECADAVFERSVEARISGDVQAFCVVRLNAEFILDAIDACRGDVLRIGVGGELEPVTVRGHGNRFMAIVMPMRRT